MFQNVISKGLALILLFACTTVASAQQITLDKAKKHKQLICWWKKGTAQQARQFINKLKLDIVLQPEGEPFVACRWKKGVLTQNVLNQLVAHPAIDFVEPDYPVYLAGQTPKRRPITEKLLAGYEFSGRMVCWWKKGKRKEAEAAIKKLNLKIEFAPPGEPFVACSWQRPLRKETLEALQKLTSLEFVEPDSFVEIGVTSQGRFIELVKGTAKRIGNRLIPEDPFFKKQWGMEHINAPRAWVRYQSSNVLVAVIDSGIDYSHPELRPNMWINKGEIPFDGIDNDKNGVIDDIHGADYVVLKDSKPTAKPVDENGHGTHVAGIIGATGNNKTGVVGVNWSARMMALRIFDKKGKSAFSSSLAAALGYAIKNKAKVINLSLRWTESESLKRKMKSAETAGVLVACSAGNLQPRQDPKYCDNDRFPHYPSSYPYENILAVANLKRTNQLSGGSHFGTKSVDLAAPGTDVYSTYPVAKGSYASLSGTSMAAPHVAGAAALIWGQKEYQALNVGAIKQLILKNTRRLSGLTGKCATEGTLDLAFLGVKTKPPVVVRPVPPIACPPIRIYCPRPVAPRRYYRIRCH